MHVTQSRAASSTAPRIATPRLSTRKDIQGLRAVAVALVVLEHAGVGLLSGGYVGVDVFFVVSGFLITQILVREASVSGKVSLSTFYSRRARRILPASTLVLLVTSLVAVLTLSASRAREVMDDVLWSSAFAANIHFARLDTDYFAADRAVSPVQHYWSLAVEEQFYLVLPLLLLVVVALGRRRLVAGKRFPGRWVTGIVVGVLSVASLAWSVIDTPLSPGTAYFSSLTRAWELGVGVVLALATPRLARLTQRTRVLLSGAGLVGILVAAVVYDATTPFPGYYALLPVLASAAVLAAGVERDGQGLARVLTWRPFTWVGDLSYSIYLWHWPALVLAAPLLVGDDPEWVVKTVVIGVVLLLSFLTYHLVEQPFRRGRAPMSRGKVALVLWPVSIAAVVLSMAGVNYYEDREAKARAAEAAAYYQAMGPSGFAAADASIPMLVEESVALADDNAPIRYPLSNLDGLREDHWAEEYPCFAAFKDTTSPPCELGDTDAETTVVAMGDSHMGMWLPALDDLGKADGFRVIPFVKWACPSVDVPTVPRFDGDDTCPSFRDWVYQQVRVTQPDVILVSNRVLPPNLDATGPEAIDVWRSGVQSTLELMAGLAPEVRVFGDVPRVPQNPGDCLSDDESTMATCTVEPTTKSVSGIIATRDAAEDAAVGYVNVKPLVCAELRCPMVVDQTVVYRDEDHISLTWSRRLTDELRDRLTFPFTSS
jgi:peptidoglycan/LPS O-acetylase OafA/YrhL